MAVLRVQENIKNADGTYDTVHKETEASLVLFDDSETLQQKSETWSALGVPVVATAGTGAAYTATVPGVTELKNGMPLIIIPHVSSNQSPTLSINGLEAKSIKRNQSTDSGTTTTGYGLGWLSKNAPVLLIFSGDFWVANGFSKPQVQDIAGTVGVAKGGTGKNSWILNGIVYASAAKVLDQIAPPSNTSLLVQDSSGEPYWGSLDDVRDAIGALPLSGGNLSGGLAISGAHGLTQEGDQLSIGGDYGVHTELEQSIDSDDDIGTIRFMGNDNDYFWRVCVGEPKLPSDAASKGYVDAAASNPNLLDNWYFVDPINQRGQDNYYPSVGDICYTIDRWKANNSMSVCLGGGNFNIEYDVWDETEESEEPKFYQILDPGTIKVGSTYTLSVLSGTELFSKTGTYNGTNGTFLDFIYDGFDITIGYDQALNAIAFTPYGPDCMANTMYFKAIKLEIGDRQTLAIQNSTGQWVLRDAPPDKALELAKCQRYFWRMSSPTVTGNAPICMAATYRANQADGIIPFPVTMRTKPSISFSGNFKVFYFNGQNASCTLSGVTTTPYAALIRATTASSVFTSSGTVLIELPSANGYIDFSADL